MSPGSRMGQQDLFQTLFGIMPPTSGRIEVDGREVTITSPRDAIRSNIGISLVPEERKTEGLFLRLDGRFNVSLPVLDRFSRAGFIDRQAEKAAVAEVLDQVEVHPRALYTPSGAFSGETSRRSPSPNGCWRAAGPC